MLDTTFVDCPYCGERIELVVDTSADDIDYVEDCEVCCRPLVVCLTTDDSGDTRVIVRTEND